MSIKQTPGNAQEWWRGAVIYQVYPRSFQDTGHDGVGDLRGILKRLDYIKALGVDALWISPFFKSPMKDYGYDVADYCAVDPLFGTMGDFKKLLRRAHGLNLKIIVDMVLSHTSDQHPWFDESRQSRDNAKSDWYVWADPKPDGGPPNNWQSHFGGPSWTYEVRRGQYYLHNFLPEQPDLNLYNPAVKSALNDAMRFWLDLGVDGFRLDAMGCYFHSPGLQDNPPNPNPAPAFFNINFPTPHSMQVHRYDFLIEPGINYARELRTLLDQYPGTMAVAEVGGEDGIDRAIGYTDGSDLLHTAYTFGLLSGDKPSARFIRARVEEFEKKAGESWPSWAFSNHDIVRVATRWGGANANDARLHKTLFALLCSLRGTAFVYQGEELGLPDAPLSLDDIQDPWGKYLYPLWQGRDGCRTPMPWTKRGPNAGFTRARAAWLPVPPEHRALNVKDQMKNTRSQLTFARRFLSWRKSQPALVAGSIQFIDTGSDALLAFRRMQGDDAILCHFNLGTAPAHANGIDLAPFECRFLLNGKTIFSSHPDHV